MTKEELVTEICGRTGLKKDVVLATVETAMDVVKETMAAGENVYLRGFGSFTLKERAAKLARNITTGEAVNVPAHLIPSFKPCNDFKALVRQQPSKQ